MGRRIRILVSGAGGDAAQGVIKALRHSNLDVEIFATCIRPESPGLHLADRGFVAPLSSSERYLPFLQTLIAAFNIDVFIPTVDSEIPAIAVDRERLESETGVRVFVNDSAQVRITADKLVTAEYLKEQGLPAALSCSAGADNAAKFARTLGLPLIIKPRRGHGSQGLTVATEWSQVDEVLGDDEWMLQEWIDPAGGEYTIGAYLGDDHEIKGICILRRELRNGSTVIAQRVLDVAIEVQVRNLVEVLQAKYLNIQAMQRDGVLIPFELNGRLSGSTAMVSKVFNAPEMFIRERVLGEKLRVTTSNDEFIAMRYMHEVYASVEDVEALRRNAHFEH